MWGPQNCVDGGEGGGGENGPPGESKGTNTNKTGSQLLKVTAKLRNGSSGTKNGEVEPKPAETWGGGGL